MHRSTNVLHRETPTAKKYLDAVAKIIRATQGDLSDADYAEKIGVSAPTVANARNRKGKLSADILARIGHEFGPEYLEPFAALFGAICIPRDSKAANDLLTIAQMSHISGDWLDRLRDGIRCHNDTSALAKSLRPLAAKLLSICEEADRFEKETVAA